MKFIFPLCLLLLGPLCASAQQPARRYTATPTGYLMVLREGDSVLQHIEAFAVAEKIPSASFSGFGFVHVRFGFFDFEKKTYVPRDLRNAELGSMQGSIAWQDGRPSIHLHGVAAGADFKAVAGHILGAVVSTGSLEITFLVHDRQLQRKKDEKLGANVLELE